MDIFVSCLYIIIIQLILAFYLSKKWVYSHALNDIYFFNKWILTFSIFLSFSIYILLIYDIYLTTNGIIFDSITCIWRVIYWVNFFLAYFLLPFCRDYHNNFYFNKSYKIKFSIIKNLLFNIGRFILLIIIIIILRYNDCLINS